MVSKFADIAKAPTDLLNDDYASKVSLKCKKKAGPTAVTIDTSRSSSTGSLASKIGAKFSYAGLSFDKVQHEADGSHTLETSMTPAPGLKLSFKGNKGADLGCDYKFGNTCLTGKLDVKDFSKLSTSAALAPMPGMVVGGNATYEFPAEKGLTGYNVGASYTTGPVFAAVTSSKFSSFNVSMMYKVSPEISLATSTSHSDAKKVDLVAVGGIYKAAFGDVKAKVSGNGVVSASLIKDVTPGVTLTASGSMSGLDTSTFKYGLGIVM